MEKLGKVKIRGKNKKKICTKVLHRMPIMLAKTTPPINYQSKIELVCSCVEDTPLSLMSLIIIISF